MTQFKGYKINIEYSETYFPKHLVELTYNNEVYRFITSELPVVMKLLNGENLEMGYVNRFLRNTITNNETNYNTKDLLKKLIDIGEECNQMRFNKVCEQERIAYYR